VAPVTGAQFFPQTGHNLQGTLRTYWEQHGGLAQFGYPISEAKPETSPADGRTYTVQYFERARLEVHPENAGTPFEVQVGQLGRQLYQGKSGPEIVARMRRRGGGILECGLAGGYRRDLASCLGALHRPFEGIREAHLEVLHPHPFWSNKDARHLGHKGAGLRDPCVPLLFSHRTPAHCGILRCDAIYGVYVDGPANEQNFVGHTVAINCDCDMVSVL
jgi:hypothetical protein